MIFAAPHIWLPPERPAIVRAHDMAGISSWEDMQKRRRNGIFPFPIFVRARAGTTAVTAVDHATNTSGFSTWNTGTRTLGTGFVVVAVTALAGNNSTDAVSSMTINGVSASLLGRRDSGPMAGTSAFVELWGADCSAATGNVTINLNASVSRGGMMIWLVTGSTGTSGASTAGSAGSNNPSANITVAAGGCVLAANANIVGTSACTWSGIATEDYDETFGGGNSYQSGAHEVYSSGGSKTISNNTTGSSGIAMTLVAFVPA